MSVESSILRLKGITKRFPGVLALNSVDMEVRRAEVTGVATNAL